MQQPPELPSVRSRKSSFAHQAAVAGLAAPLIALAMTVVIQVSRRGNPSLPTSAINGIIATLLIFTGLIASIIALIGTAKHGRKGLLGKGIAGLLLNGILVALLVAAGIGGAKRKMKEIEARREINSAISNFQAEARESLLASNGVPTGNAERMQRLQAQLTEASKSFSDADARLMQAANGFFTTVGELTKRYEAASAKLSDAEVFNIASLKDRSQIAERKLIVTNFLKANFELGDAIKNSEKILNSNFDQAQIPQKQRDQFFQGYRAKQGNRFAIAMKIRDCDRRLGESMLSILDLLDNHWGQWSYSKTDDQISFLNNSDAQTAFINYAAEIDDAAEEQGRLQRELLTPR